MARGSVVKGLNYNKFGKKKKKKKNGFWFFKFITINSKWNFGDDILVLKGDTELPAFVSLLSVTVVLLSIFVKFIFQVLNTVNIVNY